MSASCMYVRAGMCSNMCRKVCVVNRWPSIHWAVKLSRASGGGHYYGDTDEHTLVVNPLMNPVPFRGTRACQQSQSGGFYRFLWLKCSRDFTSGAEEARVQSHAVSHLKDPRSIFIAPVARHESSIESKHSKCGAGESAGRP